MMELETKALLMLAINFMNFFLSFHTKSPTCMVLLKFKERGKRKASLMREKMRQPELIDRE